jgi:N-acetyl-anhydromuramyl-L-alanine amidase AmpD
MAQSPLIPANVKYIAVHCSASKPSVYVDAKVIDRWHRERGFLKIGYHFVIKRDGTVEKGREINEIGAHVYGYNSVSVGICLAGGLDDEGKPQDNFTHDQYAALALLIIRLREVFPGAVTQGHRDFPKVAKDCPCFDVKPWVKETIDSPAV